MKLEENKEGSIGRINARKGMENQGSYDLKNIRTMVKKFMLNMTFLLSSLF